MDDINEEKVIEILNNAENVEFSKAYFDLPCSKCKAGVEEKKKFFDFLELNFYIYAKDGKFVIDLVLRNNITSEEHPLGVFHPHANLHHIKKENIGLIEVMGLAVLPSRLKNEMAILKDAILNHKDVSEIPKISKHSEWVNEFVSQYDEINENNIDSIIQNEIGKVFLNVLLDAGVFKRTPEGQKAFDKFIKTL